MKTLLIALLALASFNSFAKEVKLVIPYSVGGPTDRVSRILIKHLSNDQYKFIPEYKLGAGGALAANHVAAIKDETTLMVTSNALISSPLLSNITTYDLEKDFILVDYLGTEPLVIAVKADSKINNFKDFLQAGDKESMPYGSAGIGTSGHIGSVIVSQNNKNHIHIPYKGSAGIVVDLLNGQLKWVLDSDMNIGTFISDGKIKPIAIYARKRVVGYPSVPTLKELNINDRNFYRWHILVANKSADRNILNYVQEKLKDSSLRAELAKIGLDTDKPNLNNFFRDEYSKTDKIIKDFDIK
jgi:tripartite-type tricarboxylate transporter receptor subunit TctC